MKTWFRLVVVCFLIRFVSSAIAADWPQFLGPARNGVYSGGDLAHAWPKNGPPIVWKRNIGQGFSGPIVADGRVILFHRVENQEVVECMEASSGSTRWKYAYATKYRDDFGFDEGPRSTPSAVDGKVYSFGAEGALHCLDLASGKKMWSVDCKQQFAAPKGFFGMVCSPLVEGNHVILNIGGRNGSGIIAFEKNTGNVAWTATNDEASYSSPVAATIQDRRYGLVLTRDGLIGLDPRDGRIVFDFAWKPPMNASVSAATPLVVNELIFISASYQTGAALLRLNGNKLDTVWSSDDALSNHYATSVYRDGYLYGFHGRQESGPSIRCVEVRTGKVMWSDNRLKAGTVTLAGPSLLLMIEDGQLIAAQVSNKSFRISARAQILPMGVRAYPAIANGHFFARSKDRLVCVNLAAEK